MASWQLLLEPQNAGPCSLVWSGSTGQRAVIGDRGRAQLGCFRAAIFRVLAVMCGCSAS